MVIAGKSNEIQCEADGLWSSLNSYCESTCLGPPVVSNAKVMSLQCEKAVHEINTKCKMRCDNGYHVEGEEKNK